MLVEDELGIATLISTKALSGLFELCSTQVECVILSACYSASQAKAISKHINYVIGMRREIKNKAVIEFTVGFYDAIGAGRSVEEAFKFGCNAILQIFPDLPDHLIPVLKKKKDLEKPNIKSLSQIEKLCGKSGALKAIKKIDESKKRTFELEKPRLEGFDFIKENAVSDNRLIVIAYNEKAIGIQMNYDPVFRLGDMVTIEYWSDFSGHTILLEEAPSGRVSCIRPSSLVPGTRVTTCLNRLFPGPIPIDRSAGIYHLYAVFSTEPFVLPWLSLCHQNTIRDVSQQEMLEFKNSLSDRPEKSWNIVSTTYKVEVV